MKQVLATPVAFVALSLAELVMTMSITGHAHSHLNCTTTVFTTITPNPRQLTLSFTQTAYTTSTTTITTSLPVTANSTNTDSSTGKQIPRADNHPAPSCYTSISTSIPYPITNNTTSLSYNTSHPHPISSCHTTTIKTTLPASTVKTTSTLTVITTSITTPTPSTSCTPGVCGTFTFTPCPSAPLGDCLCGFDPDGQSFCSLDDWCQNEIGCDTNAECLTPEGGWQTGEGFRCLVGSCCDFEVPDDGQGGGSVVKKKGKCVKEKGAVCLNDGAAEAVLGVRGVSRIRRRMIGRVADGKVGGGRGWSNGGRR